MVNEKNDVDKFFRIAYVEICFEILHGRMPDEHELNELLKSESMQADLIYRANRKILDESTR